MTFKKQTPYPISDEDRALFLAAVGGKVAFDNSSEPEDDVAEVQEDFAAAVSKISANDIAQALKNKRGFSRPQSALSQPRKKKETPFEASLDLHGLVRNQAKRKIEIFIERCFSEKKRRILIVHGKGSGALREEVWEFLENDMRVASFCAAAPRHGGEGAVHVVLY